MVQKELLQAIKERLAELYGDRLKGVILFGSEARGEADEESDVDFLVLLDGPVDIGREIRAILKTLYPLQLERNFYRPLEVIPVDVEEYEEQSFSLYRHAREEGIPL